MSPSVKRSAPLTRGTERRDEGLFVQSQALGDSTRYRIFLAIRDAPEPIDVATLTDRFGLNHNAIRQHLAKLMNAGLVVDEQRPADGRGRPPRAYRLAPGASERWGAAAPNELLSLMLLDLVDDDPEHTLAVGRAMGERLAQNRRPGADTPETLQAVAVRLGFEPRRDADGAGRTAGATAPRRAGGSARDAGEDVDAADAAGDTAIVLDHCPFAAAASSAPGVVCTLHRGIAEGVCDAVGDGWHVVDLEVRPPAHAGCRIVVAPA